MASSHKNLQGLHGLPRFADAQTSEEFVGWDFLVCGELLRIFPGFPLHHGQISLDFARFCKFPRHLKDFHGHSHHHDDTYVFPVLSTWLALRPRNYSRNSPRIF